MNVATGEGSGHQPCTNPPSGMLFGSPNPRTHNVAVERSDAEIGSTPRVVQFRHPWAPPPGTKSDRVGASGIAWESAGHESLTA